MTKGKQRRNQGQILAKPDLELQNLDTLISKLVVYLYTSYKWAKCLQLV